MDPRIVDAMRAVRALEEGEEPPKDDEEEDEIEAQQRKELEALADGENAGQVSDEDTDQPSSKRRKLDDSSSQTQSQSNGSGLLNADTLEGLKYFAEIRKRHENTNVVRQSAPPKPSSTGLALDYGSDDDE